MFLVWSQMVSTSQNEQTSTAGSVQLLRGLDRQKDQSYFLASVPGSAFRSCVFPLGMMHKQDVREIAVSAGLHNADRRSSAGICFIGKSADPAFKLLCTAQIWTEDSDVTLFALESK